MKYFVKLYWNILFSEIVFKFFALVLFLDLILNIFFNHLKFMSISSNLILKIMIFS